MFNIVLYQPQIPPNTGNIIRLCANSGSILHLIRPLGFSASEKSLRRAGLDYHHMTKIKIYDSLEDFLEDIDPMRLFAITKFGSKIYSDATFKKNNFLLFGSEISGLPDSFLENIEASQKLFIPMIQNSRSLNLSNAVSLILYEAWRQNGFYRGGKLFHED